MKNDDKYSKELNEAFLNMKTECDELSIQDIIMSSNAMITIGQSIKEIAVRFKIDEDELLQCWKKSCWGSVYHHLPTGELLFVFPVMVYDNSNQGWADTEIYITIPSNHWTLKEKQNRVLH